MRLRTGTAPVNKDETPIGPVPPLLDPALNTILFAAQLSGYCAAPGRQGQFAEIALLNTGLARRCPWEAMLPAESLPRCLFL